MEVVSPTTTARVFVRGNFQVATKPGRTKIRTLSRKIQAILRVLRRRVVESERTRRNERFDRFDDREDEFPEEELNRPLSSPA